MPLGQKQDREDKFWHEMACYLMALRYPVGTHPPAGLVQLGAWPESEYVHGSLDYYWRRIDRKKPWRFTGFEFPETYADRSFRSTKLDAADFRNAKFNGEADFGKAAFNGEADFYNAAFYGGASFRGATFRGEAGFHSATFGIDALFDGATFKDNAMFHDAKFHAEADFNEAKFQNDASFEHATFDGETRFVGARFAGTARFRRAVSKRTAVMSFDDAIFSDLLDFSYGTILGPVEFMRATFGGPAIFTHTTFVDEASFYHATFNSEADFSSWESGRPPTSFKGRTNFQRATFDAKLSFEGAKFEGAETSFRDAQLRGPVLMRRTTINGLIAFNYAELRNQLFFDGTILDDNCVVLLWGLNFVHGISNMTMNGVSLDGRVRGDSISLEEKPRSGRIYGPAGQVVFRDIKANMNRVSFLHTDILTDRLLVRFSNVKWEPDPKQFIFDAKFGFVKDVEWTREKLIGETGLPDWAIDRLPELFFGDRPLLGDETLQQKAEAKTLQLQDCEPLVKQDVERIAREIRLSYEKYGHYGDAGDYYIVEMDFRRKRTP